MSILKGVLFSIAMAAFMSAGVNAQTDAGATKTEPEPAAEKPDRKTSAQKSTTTGTDNPKAAPAAATQKKKPKKGNQDKQPQTNRHDTAKNAVNNVRAAPDPASAGKEAVSAPEPDAKAPLLPPAIQAPRAPIKSEEKDDKEQKSDSDIVVKGSKIKEN